MTSFINYGQEEIIKTQRRVEVERPELLNTSHWKIKNEDMKTESWEKKWYHKQWKIQRNKGNSFYIENVRKEY